jgi:hypothetical protein
MSVAFVKPESHLHVVPALTITLFAGASGSLVFAKRQVAYRWFEVLRTMIEREMQELLWQRRINALDIPCRFLPAQTFCFICSKAPMRGSDGEAVGTDGN